MASSSSAYIGSVEVWPINFAPVGWALCAGQLQSISQNQALFALLGTNFGGDGVQTFALPNLQSRIPIGVGQGPGLSTYVLGEVGGTENATLLSNNLPIHNHIVNCDTTSTGRGLLVTPVNNYPATLPSTDPSGIYGSTVGNTMNPLMTNTAGGNTPFGKMPPFLAFNFIIALYGIWPSQS
jgi:microcystin-dependent protein